jgi:hypothetical protein
MPIRQEQEKPLRVELQINYALEERGSKRGSQM